MAKKKFDQKGIATFSGLSVGANKVVTIKFKLRYDEIITSINLLQGLNNDITIHAKVEGQKEKSLGVFNISGIPFDKDGNATVQFKSTVDNVEMENITSILYSDTDYVQLKFMAVLQLEESDVKEIEQKEENEDDWGDEEWEDD